ncbi:hypothetical protein [endosymbiont GvMRE of Glomus versiforme]|uniref:hypothetical protein n=1 Tax=endosymbiont GvMRE of Glomus versiforme TaxID=2039283 RepID=UPI000EDB86B3|nr:hypothetical protein [endosymbiont GvMRE of Glomus versiforme]RHZ35498.1 hypothetical protein GvMRE_IIg9 [endosymbiont GvMRE of Glomus versiforme]
MTRPNENLENENTWESWATGKLAMFTIGLAAGYALYQMGVLQKFTEKIFTKKD